MLKPILTKPVHGILHSVVNHAPRVQGKNIITAVIVPALGMLRDGDAIGDFISADIDSAANYASTEGTISSVDVVITVNGSAATTATTVSYTDNVQIAVTVTDNAANQRVWVRNRMVAGIAPVNTVAVSISGDVELDGVLTVAAGSWTGVPTPDLTYQWLRDEQPIIGANGTTYTISMADSETVISVRETATNSAGVESVASNVVAVPDLNQPQQSIRTVALLGQSEVAHIFNDGSFYRQIPSPDLTGREMSVILEDAAAGDTTTTPWLVTINEQTKASNNPSLVAITNILTKLLPDTTVNLVDFAIGGTSLQALVDDSNDNRSWAVLEQVKDFADQEFGGIDLILQNWWNSTRSNMKTFGPSYAPALIGERWNGQPYELGTPVTDAVTQYKADHCFWDVSGQNRGLFDSNTKFSLMGFGPAISAPTSPDAQASSYNSSGTFSTQLDKPARQAMEDFVNDPRLAPFSAGYGVSSHICKFGDLGAPSGSTAIHQSVLDPDGQILFAQHTAIAIAQALGANIYEPEVIGIEPEGTGAYADLIISLPNGGDLTTIRKLRNETQPNPLPPHWNEAIGFEINGSPFNFTATIIDIGSGSPKQGRVRITPNEGTLLNGTAIEYLRGSSTAILLRPRDEEAEVYKDMLLEHIPALAQNETYPYAGIPVKPHCPTQVVSGVVEPEQPDEPYDLNLVNYASGIIGSDSLSANSSGNGIISIWFRNDQAVWNSSIVRMFQARIGTTPAIEVYTATNGRLALRLLNSTTNVPNFGTDTNDSAFELGRAYHLLISWTPSRLEIRVDGVLARSVDYDTLNVIGTISRFAVGAQTTNSGNWVGAIGQVYFNLTQTLDMNDPSNVAKFYDNGDPVSLGSNGQLPTGSAPAFFVDAPFDQVSNLGVGGVLSVSGTLAGGN